MEIDMLDYRIETFLTLYEEMNYIDRSVAEPKATLFLYDQE